MNLLSGEGVIARIREETDTVLLSFSTGKDSIATWLALRPYFRVVPYYLYGIPDLSFINKSLKYYEEFFDTKIHQLPHPSLARKLKNMVFQAPENCELIYEANIPNINYLDQMQMVAKKTGVKNPWVATGLRAADSPMRRIVINKRGAINYNEQKFYPIWDWNKKRLINELTKANIKLPVDYKLFGRSFDGIDYRFLKPLKDNFPEDYQKVIDIFPFARLEIMRREAHIRHMEQKK